jgi:Family of unknown function (DUF5678)
MANVHGFEGFTMSGNDDRADTTASLDTDDKLVEKTAAAAGDFGATEWPKTQSPLACSQAAFKAELSELLQQHRGKWVAFANGKMVRLGNTRSELYRHCLNDLGLMHDHFVVRRIIPESSPQIEYNLR